MLPAAAWFAGGTPTSERRLLVTAASSPNASGAPRTPPDFRTRTAWRHPGDSTPHLQDKSGLHMLGGEVQRPRTARPQRLSGPRRAEKVLAGEAMKLALQA